MIIACGEALIDMLPRTTSAGDTCYMPVAGGAVFNTAIALGRLGAPVGFFSGISTDFFGDVLFGALRESDVDASYVVRSNHPETLAFVRLVDGHAHYAFYDEATAGRSLNQSDIPDLDDRVTALQFGAISLISEPCGGTYEEMMRREHCRRVIALDPNIRPSFIRDKAAHLARMERMLAMSDIVKLSDEDLAFFSAGDDFEGFAGRLLKGKARLVVMTRGAAGAVGICHAGRVEVPGVAVAVVDTVGAGDTVNAGILAWLHRSDRLSKAGLESLSCDDVGAALSLAVRAASITVSRAGANPPWAHEMPV